MIEPKIKGIQLSELKTGQEGIITNVLGEGPFRKRITEMGLVKGKKIKVIKNAPLQDPIEYEIMDYRVSLRRSETQMVEVLESGHENWYSQMDFQGIIDENILKTSKQQGKGKTINIAWSGIQTAEKQLCSIMLPDRMNG